MKIRRDTKEQAARYIARCDDAGTRYLALGTLIYGLNELDETSAIVETFSVLDRCGTPPGIHVVETQKGQTIKDDLSAFEEGPLLRNVTQVALLPDEKKRYAAIVELIASADGRPAGERGNDR